MMLFSLALFLVFGVLIVWVWSRRMKKHSAAWLNPTVGDMMLRDAPPPNIFGAPGVRPGVWTKIIFNGREYSDPAEMPADVRAAYERAVGSVLIDADRDGVPDILEGHAGATVFQSQLNFKDAHDPVERLKKLNEMKESGLITAEEYETKKAEILSEM